MKTLIITTGSEGYIMGTWLPSLRSKGQYNGDVLIVDYNQSYNCTPTDGGIIDGLTNGLKPFTQETIEQLKQDSHVLYHRVHNRYPCIASDRIHAFNTALSELNLWTLYDIMGIFDGNDIKFLGSIQPLLKAAQTELCVTAQKGSLKQGERMFTTTSEFLFKPEEYETIKEKPMINAGVFAATPTVIKELFEYMLANMEINAAFGSEQLSLNLYCYSEKHPYRDMGEIYNFLPIFLDRSMTVTYQAEISKELSTDNGYTYEIKNPEITDLTFDYPNGKKEPIAVLHSHQKHAQKVCLRLKDTVTSPTPLSVGDKTEFKIVWVKGSDGHYWIHSEPEKEWWFRNIPNPVQDLRFGG